jgi:fumarate hydratase subunit beta
MDGPIRITTPITEEDSRRLRAGDRVLLSGVIYTGRDAAHKRLVDLLQTGQELPVDLRGQVIYYVGPAPARPGRVIGSAGPTTSGRMDAYAPLLIAKGLRGMIGKGLRNQAVVDAMKEHGAVYFGATGGAAALLARRVVSCEVVAYEDLGTEAIHRLVVEDFPLIVINDAWGGDLYREGVKAYERGSGTT